MDPKLPPNDVNFGQVRPTTHTEQLRQALRAGCYAAVGVLVFFFVISLGNLHTLGDVVEFVIVMSLCFSLPTFVLIAFGIYMSGLHHNLFVNLGRRLQTRSDQHSNEPPP